MRLATKEAREGTKKRIPLGRGGKVKDIADATVYLFSEAGGFVNGEVLVGELFFSPPLLLLLLLLLTTSPPFLFPQYHT